MLGFFVIIGVIMLLVGIGAGVFKFFVRDEDVRTERGGYPDFVTKAHPPVLRKFGKLKTAGILILISIPFLMAKSLLFNAEIGYNYHVQSKFGGTKVYTTAIGLTWKGFGIVTQVKDYFTISTVKGSSSHIPWIDIAFADKETAKQPITYRIEIPQDEAGFETLILKFRSQENLIRSITPKVQEVVSNTAFMFTGQGYTSGEAPAFNQAVRDQLALGSYILVAESISGTKRNTLTADSLKVMHGQNGPVLKRTPKLDTTGKPMRDVHSFMRTGISITNVSLPKADFSPEFDKRMNKQRKQSGDFQNSILERKTIVEQTKLEIAKGEKVKVVERLAQEKAAVSKITAANTKLLQDSIVLNQRKIALATAKVNADIMKTNKDAESYAVRKMNVAGIDPVVKYKMELAAKVAIEEAKAKTKWPVYYMPGGSGGKGGGTAMDLMMLKAIKDVNVTTK